MSSKHHMQTSGSMNHHLNHTNTVGPNYTGVTSINLGGPGRRYSDVYSYNNVPSTSAGGNGNITGAAGQKDRKRKRDMVDKVRDFTDDMYGAREEIYEENMSNIIEDQESLLSIPPNNIEYLLGVQRYTLARENELLQVHLQYESERATAQLVHQNALQHAEEEYAVARRAVIDKLRETCEERRRTLVEEKDNLESLFDPTKLHSTRGARRPNQSPSKSGNADGEDPTLSSDELEAPTLMSISAALSALLSSSPSSAQMPSDALTAAFPLLARSITVAANARPSRRGRVRGSQWSEGSKQLNGAKAEEIDGDLGELRRRKPRMTRGMVEGL